MKLAGLSGNEGQLWSASTCGAKKNDQVLNRIKLTSKLFQDFRPITSDIIVTFAPPLLYFKKSLTMPASITARKTQSGPPSLMTS
ncbi:hypothetical protein ACL7TT_17785 [Microbulbifer sp. 2304DJ12-6]|uniref:hypothetical protein n=1 Tax=Microbulbifer sp. 2304DJ12-6 TaxID=3233340 RepID=UPI0039B0F8D8